MQSDRCGLKERAHLIGYVVADRNYIVLGDYDVLRKAAELSGSYKTVILAEGVIASLAVLALHAGNQRKSCDSRAGLHLYCLFSHFLDNAGELMSQYVGKIMACISVNSGNI